MKKLAFMSILFFGFCKAQNKDTITRIRLNRPDFSTPRVYLNVKPNFVKRNNVLTYRTSIFKITASAKFKGNLFEDIQNLDFSNNINYELRTKIYVNKRIHLLLRSQITSSSKTASFGIIFKINR